MSSPGDLNLDAKVDGADLQAARQAFRSQSRPAGWLHIMDMDRDRDVDCQDLALLKQAVIHGSPTDNRH